MPGTMLHLEESVMSKSGHLTLVSLVCSLKEESGKGTGIGAQTVYERLK